MDEKLLSISEAVKLLGVCENTLRDWDIEGKFKAIRTAGNHRRYSLDQIRKYLEENPLKLINKDSFNPNICSDIRSRWESHLTNYKEQDKRVLSVLLENNVLMNDSFSGDKLFSTSQIIWLVKESWLRAKFRHLVSVQPLCGPCGMVYHCTRSGNTSKLVSEAVAAKTLLYDFSVFCTAKFEDVKDAYADAIAFELDVMIMKLLPKVDIEEVIDALAINPQPLKDWYDYVITDADSIELLSKNKLAEGVSLYCMPALLDPESFKPVSYCGKYSSGIDNNVVFSPYILINVAPTYGAVRKVMYRGGSHVFN